MLKQITSRGQDGCIGCRGGYMKKMINCQQSVSILLQNIFILNV